MTNSKLTTIYIVGIEDDEVGEVQGAFDAKGNLLDFWARNDATWRGEYFEGFMNALGFTTRARPPLKLGLEGKLKASAKETWDL